MAESNQRPSNSEQAERRPTDDLFTTGDEILEHAKVIARAIEKKARELNEEMKARPQRRVDPNDPDPTDEWPALGPA